MKASADLSNPPSTLTRSLIGRKTKNKALGGPCGSSSSWLPSQQVCGSYMHRLNCSRSEWATSLRLALSSRPSLAYSGAQSKQRQLSHLSRPHNGTIFGGSVDLIRQVCPDRFPDEIRVGHVRFSTR